MVLSEQQQRLLEGEKASRGLPSQKVCHSQLSVINMILICDEFLTYLERLLYLKILF